MEHEQLSGEEKLRRKLSGMRPGKTHMIASGYRVERNREAPYDYRLKAPNRAWSSWADFEGMVRLVKNHGLNCELLWLS